MLIIVIQVSVPISRNHSIHPHSLEIMANTVGDILKRALLALYQDK
jgi:hypothetical protein